MLRLAIPVFFSQCLDMLVGLTDSWLAGNFLGEAKHLAAMNLVNYVLWFLVSMFGLVAIGTTAVVARSVGAGLHDEARRISNASLGLGLILCLLPMALIYFFGKQFALLLYLTPEAAELASRYWLLLIPALPALMIEAVGGAALRAAGDTITPTISMIVVNLVDMVLSYCLVTGAGPFPNLGWDGLVLGSVGGYLAGTGIMLAALHWGPAGLKLHAREMRWDKARTARILRIGVPGGVDMLAMIGCHLAFVRVVNLLGENAAAAHGIAIRLESLSYLPAFAFQVAATTMVGQFLGAGKPDRAARSVYVACAVGEAFVLACCVLLYFGSDWLTAQFTTPEQSAIAAQAASLLRIVCFAQPALVILMILIGSLRGAGDTLWPLLLTFVGLICIRIPLAIVLAWDEITLPGFAEPIALFGWGLHGAWYAMVADLFTRTLMAVYRFKQGAWRRVKV